MTTETAAVRSAPPPGGDAAVWFMRSALPVLVVTAIIVALWYAAAVWLNAQFEIDQRTRAGTPWTWSEIVPATLEQERPVLPTPRQVFVELWKTTVDTPVTSKRSLVYHGWITLSSTLVGFGIGTLLGIVLAILIIHSKTLDKSLMPWIVSSQTVPILAIAPMIIVVLNAIGVSGLLPKALISAYLSFFPVAVGMVKGLRSPEPMLLDLMRTYNASGAQTFWKLRWPSALPYLFTSMKVAVAISLVGAIVGELPTGAVAGLGARLLAGSYYGQTIQIWAALFMAAAVAALLVGVIGLLHGLVLRRMGMACVATIHGISDLSAARLCTISTASRMPSAVPMAKPSSAAESVTQAW
jgi:NitT/TauT family transport system permease protein